VSQLSVVSIP